MGDTCVHGCDVVAYGDDSVVVVALVRSLHVSMMKVLSLHLATRSYALLDICFTIRLLTYSQLRIG